MRLSQTVSTVRKSQASIVPAWWRRNTRQLSPSCSRAGWQPMADQDRADRARWDAEAEAAQLTDDPPVAPSCVLPREADDENFDLAIDRWRSGSAMRVCPAAR